MPTHTASKLDDFPNTAYIRAPQVLHLVPFSTSTLWRKVSDGTFPKPAKLSANVTAWKIGDVRAWLEVQATETNAAAHG